LRMHWRRLNGLQKLRWFTSWNLQTPQQKLVTLFGSLVAAKQLTRGGQAKTVLRLCQLQQIDNIGATLSKPEIFHGHGAQADRRSGPGSSQHPQKSRDIDRIRCHSGEDAHHQKNRPHRFNHGNLTHRPQLFLLPACSSRPHIAPMRCLTRLTDGIRYREGSFA